MEVGDDDRQLLFDVVGKGQVVLRESVTGVHAKRVDAIGAAVLVLDVFFRATACQMFFIETFNVEASAEPVVGHSEELIVNQTVEAREEAHHQDKVPGGKHAFQDSTHLSDFVFKQAKHGTHRKEDSTVAVITVHNREEEGEGNNLEDGRVDFAVGGILVSVDGHLMEKEHVVCLKSCGRHRTQAILGLPSCKLSGVEVLKLLSDDFLLLSGNPNEANESLAVQLEQVQRVVDRLLLGNKPLVDLKSRNTFLFMCGRRVHFEEIVRELID